MNEISKTDKPSTRDPEQSQKYRAPINVNSQLDEYGLDPYEFRVYSHVARRAGTRGACFSKVNTIAAFCKISPRKVRYSLRFLCEAGLLIEEKRQGSTTRYKLAPMSAWTSSEELEALRQKIKHGDSGN